nr:hypothetical protein [bacterium]
DVLRSIFHARPVDVDDLDEPIETELTRAARSSVDNADRILKVDEFDEDDFVPARSAPKGGTKTHTSKSLKQKQRKAERKRKTKAKKRK